MKKLEQVIGYSFKNHRYLEIAITHSSYANESRERKLKSNERLEFLGDSVLGLVSAAYLFGEYPDVMEGELTKMRSALVCEGALCSCARDIGLGEYLRLGKGEESGGGRERPSILADAMEALIGAVYLDAGFDTARKFIMERVIFPGEKRMGRAAITDYKTALQEIVQKNHGEVLSYRLIDSCGPDHQKSFSVEVLLNSNVIGKGVGHSKKEAEQMAAKEALELMGL